MSLIQQSLIETARAINRLGINHGTAGNVSARLGDALLITPSGVPYEQMTDVDLVTVQADGSHHCPAGHRPSSEWRFHLDLLGTRPEFHAVVHTHGKAAASMASLRRAIPPFHYMVAVAGGNNIRCAPYATFGTAELSQHVLAAMHRRRACLLANHGLVAAGGSLVQALAIAVEVEALCEMYWRCLQIAEPYLLTDKEMTAVIDQFNRGYGAGPALAAGRTSATD